MLFSTRRIRKIFRNRNQQSGRKARNNTVVSCTVEGPGLRLPPPVICVNGPLAAGVGGVRFLYGTSHPRMAVNVCVETQESPVQGL